MTYRVVVAPSVVDQFTRLVEWWNKNRSDSRVDLHQEFDRALDFLQRTPLAAPRYRFDRRYLIYQIKTTPYLLLYRVDDAQRVVALVSAWSAQRGEGPELP